MKIFAQFTLAAFVLTLLGGCAGLLGDAMMKSSATGGTYSEVAKNFPPLSTGNGRLYIYRTEASTKTNLVFMSGLHNNPTMCTVDDTAFEIIWEAFKFIDLPEGKHRVSCGNDVFESRFEGLRSKEYYHEGTNVIEVSVSEAAEAFVRVDNVEKEPFFKPVLIDNNQGHEEILKLPHHKYFFSHMGGKIISRLD